MRGVDHCALTKRSQGKGIDVTRASRGLWSWLALGCSLAVVLVLSAGPAFAATGQYLIANASAPSGVASGAIDSGSNPQDILSVFLWAGERLEVDETFSRPFTVMQLYAPGAQFSATDVISGTIVADRSAGSIDPLSYTATVSGYFSMRVTAPGFSVSYRLASTIARPATYSIMNPSSASIAYGAPQSIAGKVYSIRDANGLVNPPWGTVTYYWSATGSDFWPYRTDSLAAHDGFSMLPVGGPAANYEKTCWMVVFDGGPNFSPSSATFVITPHALLTKPTGARVSTRRYRLQANLDPWRPAGTSPVRIYLQRKVNGHWRSAGSVLAKGSDLDTYLSATKCTATYKFPHTGAWRIQAYFPGDAKNLATRTAWVGLTVR